MLDYKDVNQLRYEAVKYDDVEGNIYSAINPLGKYSYYIDFKTLRWYLKILRKHSQKKYCDLKILDLGCGDGHISRMLVDLLGGAKNVKAFDYSDNNVEYCHSLNSSIVCLKGDVVEKIPFSEKFDGIVSFVVLSHLRHEEDVQNALKNIYNSLDSNGVFLWYELVSKSHYINPEKDTQGFNSKEIKRYAIEAGFKEIGKRSFSRTVWIGKKVKASIILQMNITSRYWSCWLRFSRLGQLQLLGHTPKLWIRQSVSV